MIRRAAAALALALASAACLSAGEPIPQVVDEYLKALRAGELRDAYDRTRLEDLLDFNPGAALTFGHFEAFWRADPLQRYEVKKVSRLEQRSIDALGEPGAPFFVVDVELIQRSGVTAISLHVEGEILAKVQLDPASVFLRLPAARDAPVAVDGVSSSPSRTGRLVTLLVLPGRHEVTAAGSRFTIETDPLVVVEGEARVVDDPERFSYVAVG